MAEQLCEAVEHLEVGVAEVERLGQERVGGAVLGELLPEGHQLRDASRRLVRAPLGPLRLLGLAGRLRPVGALQPSLVGVPGRREPLAEDLGGPGDGGIEGGPVGIALPAGCEALGPVERLLEPLDVSRREHVGRVEGVLQVVDDVRVLGRAHRRALVVGLEGGENRLGVVHEVDDEDPVLAGARPVDARVGLHDLDGVAERLVDVEGD